MRTRLGILVATLISSTALACSSDDGGSTTGAGGQASGGSGGAAGGAGGSASGGEASGGGPAVDADTQKLLDEIEAGGTFDYLGQFTPGSTSESGGVVRHLFDVTAEGPQCIDSSPFGVATRDQASENLVIYLMGGGACWPGSGLCTTNTGTSINVLETDPIGLQDPTGDSPTASWNHVFVPYCDGSLFVGDIESDIVADAPGNPGTFEGTEVQHGLQNLSAAMDVTLSAFPTAKRVIVSGSSAGGFATLWATSMARKYYPTSEILVINDAGVGVQTPDDNTFKTQRTLEWGADGRYPASCEGCEEDPHFTKLVLWAMGLDTNFKVSAFSSHQDSVIADIFLGIPGAEFEPVLISETDKIQQAFPDRFRRFFIPGVQHTALGQWDTTTRDGVTFKAWTIAMIEGDESAWVDSP